MFPPECLTGLKLGLLLPGTPALGGKLPNPRLDIPLGGLTDLCLLAGLKFLLGGDLLPGEPRNPRGGDLLPGENLLPGEKFLLIGGERERPPRNGGGERLPKRGGVRLL